MKCKYKFFLIACIFSVVRIDSVFASETMTYSVIAIPVDSVGVENLAWFNNAICTFNDVVYVSYVRPHPDSINVYQTVVGKYDNKEWSFSIVEANSLSDPWHAQPSIAVGGSGFIHIAYNMHSYPWQYAVSTQPENISAWEFRGQALNGPHNQVESSWGFYLADAQIPGLRITYQNFCQTPHGDLYTAFREAAYYNRGYSESQFSVGICRYDLSKGAWSRVGSNPDVRDSAIGCTFATYPDKNTQGATLHWDNNGRLHASWIWYASYEFNDCDYRKNWASYAYSDDTGKTFFRADGKKLNLPITLDQTDTILSPSYLEPVDTLSGYFKSYTELSAMPDGSPIVLLYSRKGSIYFVRYLKGSGWSAPIISPYGARKFIVDKRGDILGVSTGIRVHKSVDSAKTWTTWSLPSAEGIAENIWMDYSYAARNNQLRFLIQNKMGRLKIYTVNIQDNNTGIDSKNRAESVSIRNIAMSPNPFNPVIRISFQLEQRSFLTIKVFNSNGQCVKKISASDYSPGYHYCIWDGRDDNGMKVGAGLYFIRLSDVNTAFNCKVVLLE